MGELTFQIIDGLEAGQVFRNLDSPVTIGREEDNLIRLNDERISRFHAKIQVDANRVILTDLESTNGTRVNGHPIRMRILTVGDQIHVGRCVLVYGSPEELQSKIEVAAKDDDSSHVDTEVRQRDLGQVYPDAFPNGPPELPRGLSPTQAVEVSNLIDYVRTEVLMALYQVQEPVVRDAPHLVKLPGAAWHRLQKLPLKLANYLKDLSDPTHAHDASGEFDIGGME